MSLVEFWWLQHEPLRLLSSRGEYCNKCPLVSMPASLSTSLWTHRLKKKILYIYIYKKCRYFYIFCMVLLKKKFLCIFYIYTDLLNLIIGNQLKKCFDIFYMNIAQFYLNLAFVRVLHESHLQMQCNFQSNTVKITSKSITIIYKFC